jgi:hypothetical protein
MPGAKTLVQHAQLCSHASIRTEQQVDVVPEAGHVMEVLFRLNVHLLPLEVTVYVDSSGIALDSR